MSILTNLTFKFTIMSLSITLNDSTSTYDNCLYDTNITHNLGKMATKAGLYEALWKPYRLYQDYKQAEEYDLEMEFEESQLIIAKDIVETIALGLTKLKADPELYKTFNSPNGWGMYKHFVSFVEEYLEALKEYPEAIVIVSR